MRHRALGAALAVAVALGCGSRDEEPVTELDLPSAGPSTRVPEAATKRAPPSPAPPAEPIGPATDAREALLTSFRNTQRRKHRTRATLEVMAGAGAGTSRWTSEWQPPDRRRGTMTFPNGREAYMLAIGTQVWGRRSPAAAWEEAPPGAGTAGDLEQRIAEAIQTHALRAERVGEETLDGRPVAAYAITWTQPAAQGGGTMLGRIFIGADGLAYKFEGESDRPATRVSLTYEYDESIVIEPPPPPAPTSPTNPPSR